MTDDRLDLIDALLYADAFDCAVTLDELRRYARRPVEREELRGRLRDDPELRRLVASRDGLYCLADRRALLDERPAKIARSRVLRRQALRIAGALRHAPFVRGFALTGSVAPDGAAEGADVDVLVIVAPGRIGTVFASARLPARSTPPGVPASWVWNARSSPLSPTCASAG